MKKMEKKRKIIITGNDKIMKSKLVSCLLLTSEKI